MSSSLQGLLLRVSGSPKRLEAFCIIAAHQLPQTWLSLFECSEDSIISFLFPAPPHVLFLPQTRLSPKLFHEITQAFKACVVTAKGEAKGTDPGKYKVTDSTGESAEPNS